MSFPSDNDLNITNILYYSQIAVFSNARYSLFCWEHWTGTFCKPCTQLPRHQEPRLPRAHWRASCHSSRSNLWCTCWCEPSIPGRDKKRKIIFIGFSVTRFDEILPLWQNVERLLQFYRVYFVFGKMLCLIWSISNTIGQIYFAVNCRILKK